MPRKKSRRDEDEDEEEEERNSLIDSDDEYEPTPKKKKGGKKKKKQQEEDEEDEEGGDEGPAEQEQLPAYDDGDDGRDPGLRALDDDEDSADEGMDSDLRDLADLGGPSDKEFKDVIKSVTKSAQRLSSAARRNDTNSQSALLASASLAAAASAALAAAASAGSTNPQSIARALGNSAEIRSPNVAGVDRADALNKQANFAPNLPSAKRSPNAQSAAMVLTSAMRKEKEEKEAVKENLASSSKLELFDDEDFGEAVRSSARRRYASVSASAMRKQAQQQEEEKPKEEEKPEQETEKAEAEAEEDEKPKQEGEPEKTEEPRSAVRSSFRSATRSATRSASQSLPSNITHDDIMNLSTEQLREKLKDKDGNFDAEAYQKLVSTQRYPFLKLLRAGLMESPMITSSPTTSISRSPYPVDDSLKKVVEEGTDNMIPTGSATRSSSKFSLSASSSLRT